MLLVICDTTPVNYLVLIGHIDLLPILFENVTLPSVVRDELANKDAPAPVRNWIAAPPPWVEVRQTTHGRFYGDEALDALDEGEKAAIALATELAADLILMDDRAGVAVALRKKLKVAGTLGILDLAAERGLIDIRTTLELLRKTNFHYRDEILAALLNKHVQGRR